MEPYDANVKFTDHSEEMEPEWEGKRRESMSVWEGRRMLVWVGGGLLLLLIAILVLFVSGSIRRPAADGAGYGQDISHLERTLQDLERLVQSQAEQLAHLQRSQERLLTETTTLANQMGRMPGELLAAMQKNVPAKPAAPTPPAPATPAAAAPAVAAPQPQKAARYHVVRRGDTLYGISRQYGLTLTDLLRINKLNKEEAIRPGQKLLVSH